MQASDIKRLREVEEENRRLKQISADLLLENRALKALGMDAMPDWRDALARYVAARATLRK